jgi:DNA-binding response OmpR family regulator
VKAVVLVYSDDRTVREDVVNALGPTLGGVELEVREAATQAAVLAALTAGVKDPEDQGIDCCIFDAEATPVGGMGLSKQIRDEYDPCPPVLLLVARPQDSWLATWSRAEAIHPYPIDPMTLPKQVEDLVFIDEEAA